MCLLAMHAGIVTQPPLDRHKISISTTHNSRERLGRVDSGETTACQELEFLVENLVLFH